MKKKIIILVSAISFLLVLIVSLRFIFRSEVLEDYSKYSTSIIVSSNNFDPILINVVDDGYNAKISSNQVNKETYIQKNEMLYLDGNTFYKLKLNKSYRDIYNILKKCDKKRVSNEGENVVYNVRLKNKELNSLLEAMFFGKRTLNDANATMVVSDKKISLFQMNLNGIDGYDEIKVDIRFEALNEKQNLDMSLLNDGNEMIPGLRKKYVDTNDNIYEIVQ